MMGSVVFGAGLAFAFRIWDTKFLIPARENYYREREAAVRAKKAKIPVPQPSKQ
jgi:hypothetical protein